MGTDADLTAQSDPTAAASENAAPGVDLGDALASSNIDMDDRIPLDAVTAPTQPMAAATFQTRNSALGPYVAYVPSSYTGKAPMRVIVGLHGCGDDAYNFATWAVNPWATRATQTHIGISVGGETGGGKCWAIGRDDDKVEAAIQDLGRQYWLDWKRIVVAGYSSGGQLAYRVGLTKSWRFAGIAIENSGLYAAGGDPAALLGSAGWKVPTIHRHRVGDTVFPITRVQQDWQLMWNRGFPLKTSQVPGGHSGTSDDWVNWLIPMSATFRKP